MTSTSPLKGAPTGVRPAVRAVPAYPFSPIQVPIKLDQNENPYDFPAELKAQALQKMLEQPWNRYPDLHADTLAAHIAEYEGWDVDGVVVTPGSNVLIKLLTELAGIEQTVLTVDPTFSVYTLEARMLGARLVQVPLNEDFSLPVDRLKIELERQRPGVLYITQPHAPTGHVDSVARVRELLDAAGEWVVVLDEAYYQYGGIDGRELVRQYPNALSLRTFSKAWGLAGLRAGYALAGADLATQLQKLVPAFNMSVLTQAALEVALKNPGYVQERVAEAVAERGRVQAALADHPTCQALPSQSNFFLLRTPDAEAMYRHLIDHGIVVRRQDHLTGLEGCLRVGIGTPAENDVLIGAVQALK
ncbi:pyridoxal phosphate-dependent aminotransferase [Deinococcus arenicola]|uniref:Histidinol-phosphate aminotransferase n=1 Tax=Deinococcus arenicola TaxID=2994950 RepID=A0ABU4DT11_9DEIO|nr:histidinol-phosphate transaminase [Deinococcus sp. ZS9-10]MDV6375572.1 histidinol-phosphate transaminase [Deinococcus sp. ZS9-10]